MKALMWSKPNCPQCDQVKIFMAQKGIMIEERKIGDGWSREQLLESVPDARSVPQVFLDGAYVGGINEIKRKLK